MEQGDFVDVGIGKGISSPKELILAHLNRMSLNIFSKSPLPVISEGKAGIERGPDSREIFIQAVDFLIGITHPYYDDVMKKKQEEFNDKMKEKEEELKIASISNESISLAKKTTDFENGIKYYKQLLSKDKIFFISKTDRYYEYYISEKYSLYFGLFTELNFLLFRKKWLVIEDYTEDIEENEE